MSSAYRASLVLIFLTVGWGFCNAGFCQEASAAKASESTLYDRDPQHLWNRLHAALMMRVGPDGKAYGQDRLEPLLWAESEYLIKGPVADQARAVLDEFLRERGETLIEEPAKRAILQRDLWNVATWAAERQPEDGKALIERLVRVMQSIALTPEQIAKLPDNYELTAATKKYPTSFDPKKPEQRFLPPELFEADGPWVCLSREKGHTAPLHLQAGFNPFTNSTFMVFLKLPGGRETTLDFVRKLASFKEPLYVPNTDADTKKSYWYLPNPNLPQWPQGTEVALVRRALLIDTKGKVVASPLTESVQLRVMRITLPPITPKMISALEGGLLGEIVNGRELPNGINKAADAQAFSEFQLRRQELFTGSGGLMDVSEERDFKTGFNAHGWDEFEPENPRARSSRPFPERSQPFVNNRASCLGCHRYPGVYSFNSFHSMFPFSLQRKLHLNSDEEDPTGEAVTPLVHKMIAVPIAKVEQAAIAYKESQAGWKLLSAKFAERRN